MGMIRIRKSKNRHHKGEKKKRKKDKQRFTKQKTKDRATRTSPETGTKPRCSGRVSNSSSTSCTCHITLITNSMISHDQGKGWEVLATNGTCQWSYHTAYNKTCLLTTVW